MKTPLRAVVYCRVSTQEQATEDHYSLKNQKKRARDYIKSRGWTLLDVHEDPGKSGKDADRPEYQQLLKDVRQHRCDVVVVYRLDRLSRNVKDIYDFIDLVRTKDIEFVSLTENFDTTNAMGRAMLGVNQPSRVKYPQNQQPRTATDPRYDFLFSQGRGQLEWYRPERHGRWSIERDDEGELAICCDGGSLIYPATREGGTAAPREKTPSRSRVTAVTQSQIDAANALHHRLPKWAATDRASAFWDTSVVGSPAWGEHVVEVTLRPGRGVRPPPLCARVDASHLGKTPRSFQGLVAQLEGVTRAVLSRRDVQVWAPGGRADRKP